MSPTEFSPYAGLIGGIMIGLAAVVLLAGNGRILGASGIFGGLLTLNFNGDFAWRALFVISLLIGAAVAGHYNGMADQIAFGATTLMTIIGGIIVGAGVYLGNGCTSGHGICGNARFSKRSFVSTCLFMTVAIITVYLIRHAAGV
jgi:uncharacterized protein